ncbi:MAG: N-acetylmannosamine-6-phosphate 2-epimerase [Oscillatoriales cyanobacterium RM2_1_1]|nr:N-acetylmannosamine-6-phosphate 2-epimerase [Oscillatoriales cyanobacterium SM2_3_0]NJO47641.1 N-acetylmannosamine-6-phosphate 2-epimerase [Oscillatoriales cyanobacterium RM2_1_1]
MAANLIPRDSLIVSCQAPVDSYLHNPVIIAAMARASVCRGAVAVRINTPDHIRATRAQITQPIIGLWKQQIPGYEVYITPRFEDAQAVAEAGADIIAIDATQRSRPEGETPASLITKIHQKLNKLVMADVDTIDAAIQASEAGADFVATTLYGYTPATRNQSPPAWNLLTQLATKLKLPILCEGGIGSPEMARKALDLGAYAVIIGTAITGIDAQVMTYCRELAKKHP